MPFPARVASQRKAPSFGDQAPLRTGSCFSRRFTWFGLLCLGFLAVLVGAHGAAAGGEALRETSEQPVRTRPEAGNSPEQGRSSRQASETLPDNICTRALENSAPASGWSVLQSPVPEAGDNDDSPGRPPALLTCSRVYRKDAAIVSLRIVVWPAEAGPVLQTYLNPMTVAARGGSRQRVNDREAVFVYDSGRRRGEVNIPLLPRLLVIVEGENIEREALAGFAETIDYASLTALQ